MLFSCNKSEFLFTEISGEIGLNYQYPGNDHQDVGAGVIVLDVNNDGWEDIFQAAGIFKSKLWINDKGIFKDKTKDYNLQILDSIFVFGGSLRLSGTCPDIFKALLSLADCQPFL